MHRPLLRVLLGTAVVLVLAACMPGRQAPDGNDPEGWDPDGFSVGAGDQYVALGDSYTAAPGTGPADGADGCFRTLTNYPHLIAEATGATLVDNSCSGANTTAITGSQPAMGSERPPQITGVDEDTDLVTFRLGANDFNLIGRIVLCANAPKPDPAGAPCTASDRAAGTDSVEARLDDLRTNLERGLAEIRDRAPRARLVVVGYPRVVPDEGTCPMLPLAAEDYAYGRRIMESINAALESAAATVDATYVDLSAETEGHDICGEEPWIAGVRVAPGGRATPWHPYPQESELVARLVLEELD